MSDEKDVDTMLAFCIVNPGDTEGRVVELTIPKPDGPGFALIRVLRAGVCNTDLEILQGYMGFHGILGHEFVGIVEQVNGAEWLQQEWIGKRVCGDINVGCQNCIICQGSFDHKSCQMSRNHCPNRSVLGILNRHGTMAEYITLPVTNLHIVPDDVPDEVAVFAEPLAAACRIPEQGLIDYSPTRPDRVAILGDGKLGLMIAEVLGRYHMQHVPSAQKPVMFGKHEHKLDFVKNSGVECRLVDECYDESTFNGISQDHAQRYDVVIEATGSPAGLTLASGMCRPMGTLVSYNHSKNIYSYFHDMHVIHTKV